MKVQCDVCTRAAASFLCCADEAALCADCDLRVHAANKLASKHERLPLTVHCPPSCCDICQEKSGLFFCVEDRALLCRDCDVGIHRANEFTKKHTRMLVSGMRVGLEAAPLVSHPSQPLSPLSPIESKTKDALTYSDVSATEKLQNTMPQLAPLQSSNSSSFTHAPAPETKTHVALSAAPSSEQLILEPSVSHPTHACSPSSKIPTHWVTQAVNEPRTTFAETPSMVTLSSIEWNALTGAFPIDILPVMSTNYLFEESIAEVPSTPFAPHLSCFQDSSLLKQGIHVNEQFSHGCVPPSFVVPKSIVPPCKQRRMHF